MKVMELESKIRIEINNPRKQYLLLKDSKGWNQLCSALDIIGDTELALTSYRNMVRPTDDGEKYLLVYGLLQTLFVQQNAVRHLAEVLDISIGEDPNLNRVRDIRNDAIGHPTKRRSGKKQTSHFISRSSLSKWGFTLASSDPDIKRLAFRDINLSELLKIQEQGISHQLTAILEELGMEDHDHRKMFRDKSIAAIFPPTMGYYFEKVFESIHSKQGWELGQVYLELIIDRYKEFRAELEKRGEIPANDFLMQDLDELLYPFDRLRQFFREGPNDIFKAADASIFAFFLRERHRDFVKYAEEIDENYKFENSEV